MLLNSWVSPMIHLMLMISLIKFLSLSATWPLMSQQTWPRNAEVTKILRDQNGQKEKCQLLLWKNLKWNAGLHLMSIKNQNKTGLIGIRYEEKSKPACEMQH